MYLVMNKKDKSIKFKILITTIFFGCIQLLYLFLDYLADKPVFGIFSIEQILISDASFNDFFYQTNANKEDSVKNLSGKVIIINTGSLDKDSFRLELASTINYLQEFNPKVIGIDHTFSDEEFVGSDSLFNVINSYKNIVLASNSPEDKLLNFKLDESCYGDTKFPENQISIRKYYSDTNTFAHKIASKLSQKIEPIKNETFFINYTSKLGDVFKINSPVDTFLCKFYTSEKFIVLEAKDLLSRNDYLNNFLNEISKEKAFVFGHFGNDLLFDVNNDREDRFLVPCDSNIIERKESMFGVQIHANAIENLLNPHIRFNCWTDGILYKIIKNILVFVFIYYLLFVNFGKLFNVLFLAILTFALIYVTLFFMGKYIYLEIGLTMLQFLVLEEFIEFLESMYNYYLKLKHKWVK